MKLFSHILIILVFLSFSVYAAEVNIPDLVNKHPVQTDFPNDESVILYEGVNYFLDKDGKVTKTVHLVRTMFTENSLDEYGDPHLEYYADKQDLEVKICRGYMLNGKVVDTQKNGLNQITPGALWNYPDYTGFQQLVATHTGLEWGGTSELLYTISDKEKLCEWLEGVEYFQSDEPILWKEVTITTPEYVELHYEMLQGEGNMTKTIKEGYATRVWTMKNVPPIAHDDAFEHRLFFAPTLVFTTCPDWKKAGSYMAGRITAAAETTAYINTQAEKALAGCKDPEMMVEKLAKMVRERVQSVDYGGGHFPWFLRPAEKTLASTYGNDLDQSVLLLTLLKSQGIKAKIAVSGTVYQPSLKAAMINVFDRIWVVVEIGGKKLYIDASNPQSKASVINLAGKPVFYFDYSGEAPKIIPEYTFEQNLAQLHLRAKIAKDGSYTGGGFYRAGGLFCPYYDIIEKADGVKDWVEANIAGLLPNLTIENSSARDLTGDYCEVTFHFKGDKLGDTLNNYLPVQIPETPGDLAPLTPRGWRTNNTERSNPMYFQGKGKIIVNVTFELPDNWKVDTAPADFVKESSRVEGMIKTVQSGNTVSIQMIKAIKENVIKADFYPVLRNLHQNWERRNNHLIVFKVE